MAKKDHAAKPFYSVLILAFVCSLLVSGAAVGLRPLQEANRQLDRKINILRAAGVYDPNVSVEQLFKNIETRVIDLSSGQLLPLAEINPQEFNQRQAARHFKTSKALINKQDIAGLRRLENFSLVYLVKKHGKVHQVILPIRGKGLWSTMFGYVSLSADMSTINGITFYDHGETPGLGGEIENSAWQAGWQNKQLFNTAGQVVLQVVKGKVKDNAPGSLHQVDGISGATLTMDGINNLMQFWFGQHGFKPFIDRYAGGFDERG